MNRYLESIERIKKLTPQEAEELSRRSFLFVKDKEFKLRVQLGWKPTAAEVAYHDEIVAKLAEVLS